MDGKQLTRAVLDYIDDHSLSGLRDKQRRIYECLDQAAAIFCRETKCLTSTATLTTTESGQHYDLPPDFIDLYMRRSGTDRYYVRYYDGSVYSWPSVVSLDRLFRSNLTDTKETPTRVAIRSKESQESLIQGTADAAGESSNGLAILQDDSMLFTTENRVWPRDIVHNKTDGSDGVVVEVTDSTHLKVALFNGNDNDWSEEDVYTIIPAAEHQLSLEAPAATAGHRITVPYLCMPTPVYSDYGFWSFAPRVCRGIAAGAAALLQLPEQSYDESKVLTGLYADEIRRYRIEKAQASLRSRRRPS